MREAPSLPARSTRRVGARALAPLAIETGQQPRARARHRWRGHDRRSTPRSRSSAHALARLVPREPHEIAEAERSCDETARRTQVGRHRTGPGERCTAEQASADNDPCGSVDLAGRRARERTDRSPNILSVTGSSGRRSDSSQVVLVDPGNIAGSSSSNRERIVAAKRVAADTEAASGLPASSIGTTYRSLAPDTRRIQRSSCSGSRAGREPFTTRITRVRRPRRAGRPPSQHPDRRRHVRGPVRTDTSARRCLDRARTSCVRR